MSDIKTHVALARSARTQPAGATVISHATPDEIIDLTIRLPRRVPHGELTAAVRAMSKEVPRARKYLTRAEFANAYGANPQDIEKVMAFASRNGLAVTETSVARRSVHVRGTVSAASRAFGVTLQQYQVDGDTYRSHIEPVMLPAEVAPLVEAVLGFDTRPYARPHFRIAEQKGDRGIRPHVGGLDFSPIDLAKLYEFPDGDGAGQTIGVIELMMPHGSGFRLAELHSYFQSLGVPTPEFPVVSVDSGTNLPGTNPLDRQCGDGEVMLDLEIVGAIAPKARVVVYFAPNTAQGFVDVISKAVHDNQHNPSVISLSWGSSEDASDQTTAQVDQILHAAAAMGVTFCVASGDSGSRDNLDDPDHAAVDFPASSPFALSCGGTRLATSGGAITSEVVWEGASGGGVSRIFDLPDYQTGAGVPHAKNPAGAIRRGVPDVSGNGDSETGYRILVDGQHLTFGGTSAVAPLWAALVARLNQKLGHSVGFLNPVLYAHREVLRDIVSGANIDYQAGTGWDPCTGLGSPNGEKLLSLLSGL